ncbi:hypothetical protein N1031_16025 [Herbiconiux moechotypicola]|uniref:HEAT repeat domain-containing protein n=1 Tax=Herbiconiux moechotypicola TaxID=637393 RepID=A0ABP5QWC7_9MICO|nr:hypothetical protein [Herbiconiux moechotypicola]MCS5731273.1 hypothetical protein [Herbiconiux moechotypicola]
MKGGAGYRERLEGVPEERWGSVLAAESGLPGPRANLALASAAAELASPALRARWRGSDDEFEALCGTIALGWDLLGAVHHGAAGDGEASAAPVIGELAGAVRHDAAGDGEAGAAPFIWELVRSAGDARWRVREGVAMALQHVGDVEPGLMWRIAEQWTTRATALMNVARLGLASGEGDADDADAQHVLASGMLLLRAVVAAIAEPRLVRDRESALRGQALLEAAMTAITRPGDGCEAPSAPTAELREARRVLRQTLGYGWSVLAVGTPDEAFDTLDRWAEAGDADARWIVAQNCRKARLRRLDPARADALRKRCEPPSPPAPPATPAVP